MSDPTLTSSLVTVFKGFLVDILKLWWLLLLILGVKLLIVIIEARRKNKKYSAISDIQLDKQLLANLRSLSPTEFEDYIVNLFSKLGFTAERVGGAYDGGIDVIATKDGIKYYIQCKKFISSQVSVGAVRDFYGALVDHLANSKGYFITTNKFTLEAEKFAEDKSIELIDSHRLLEYIKLAQGTNKDKCPQCGGELLEKKGKYGRFLGCSNYPKCKFTKKY